MKVKQIAEDLNIIFKELVGTYNPETEEGIPLYKEDLSNFIDVGRKIVASDQFKETDFDNYVGKLIDRIGKSIIVDKNYESTGPDLAVDSVEWGAIIQKVRIADDIEFEENPAWSLVAGESYDYFTFKPVGMEATYFAGKTTFNLEWSWLRKQIMGSLTNLQEFLGIYAAIENRVKTKAKIATDGMKWRLVNGGNAENIAAGKNVINLLEEYQNATGDTSLTSEHALASKEFLRSVVVTLKKYRKFLKMATKMFNLQNELNWTQSGLEMVSIIDLESALETYLESDTYHNEFVSFDGYSSVAAWQGITEGLDFDLRSSINVVTPETKQHIMYSGIVFTMFDRSGKVVWNEDPEYEVAPYNPKGKFTNYFYSYDCNYMLDTAENCIVFTLSDYAIVHSEPADWGTGSYYNLDSESGEYVPVTAEKFADAGVVYRKLVA